MLVLQVMDIGGDAMNVIMQYLSEVEAYVYEDQHVEIKQCLHALYYWSNLYRTALDEVIREVGMSKKTLIKHYKAFREIAQEWCEQHLMPHMIGGPNTVVEIDESVFHKTKYSRGRRREHTWVFGMIERGTNNVIMIPVDRRDANTLIPLIVQYIQPGTRIISDGWRAYAGIENLQHLVNNALVQRYGHDSVIHAIILLIPMTPPYIHKVLKQHGKLANNH